MVHSDCEWRSILGDDRVRRLIVIDLEDLKWSKRRRALEPTSGDAGRRHRYHRGKPRKNFCLLNSHPITSGAR